MRSIQTRLALALAAALLIATVPVLPAPPAWADDDVDVDVEDVGKVKRGDKDVELRADVKESNLICKFKIKYADGNTDTVGEDESDKNGICKVKFDVPTRTSVVGWATAKVKVETKKGTDRGSESRNFSVRPRRGG
jgi:hypothetical protein